MVFYVIGHVVKEHQDSEKGNSQPPLFGLFFPISTKQKGIFYMHHPADGTGHTISCRTGFLSLPVKYILLQALKKEGIFYLTMHSTHFIYGYIIYNNIYSNK